MKLQYSKSSQLQNVLLTSVALSSSNIPEKAGQQNGSAEQNTG